MKTNTPRARRRGRRKEIKFPKSINWNRPYREIADALSKRLGMEISIASVSAEHYKRFGKKRSRGRYKIDPKTDPTWAEYRKWDWTLQDAELERLHGVLRQRVEVIRRRLEKPRSPNWRVRKPAPVESLV